MFQTFYHELLRKYVVIFGTLFNNIYINRSNDGTDLVQTIKVPIGYAPKEKMLARVHADPSLNKQGAILLPRMSFETINFIYNSGRKLSSVGKRVRVHPSDPNKHKYFYNPVPYDIAFNLYIYVKNTEDGTKIIEQILPYFTPDYTLAAYLLEDVDVSTDVPVVLQSVSCEDIYEGNFDTRRSIVWTLSFSMKATFYGPEKHTNIIKFANTTIHDLTSNNELSRVTVQPGLTANGTPTTNAASSISYTLINANDDYGYATTITEL